MPLTLKRSKPQPFAAHAFTVMSSGLGSLTRRAADFASLRSLAADAHGYAAGISSVGRV